MQPAVYPASPPHPVFLTPGAPQEPRRTLQHKAQGLSQPRRQFALLSLLELRESLSPPESETACLVPGLPGFPGKMSLSGKWA